MHPFNIKTLSENMPKNIEIQKKYRSKINIKMAAISEAKQIEVEKYKYKNMISYDCNRTNSPNFQKVNFV